LNTFRTELSLKRSNLNFTHRDGIVMMGSCFSENIGAILKRFRFDVETNSHGILFNPISISNALLDVMNGRKFIESDLLFHNGFFHSLSHHGLFSENNAAVALSKINDSIDAFYPKLKSAKLLLVTYGSAWVYYHNESNQLVANCHKIPHSEFAKKLLTHTEIESNIVDLIASMHSFNPAIQIVFTISPVRHLRDGFFENQISKSNLFIAISNVISKYNHCHYFPAYELVMDDLRDYRFFNEDMVHPNSLAIEYVWEKFVNWCFSPATLELLPKMDPILRFLEHRPMKISEVLHEEMRLKKMNELTALLQRT
jgi:hypothetical protein